MWSINEMYSRRDLAIVTTLVSLLTYLITLNLNNIVRLLRKVYSARRLLLVDRMEHDPNWSNVAQRVKSFQRYEPTKQQPSEWMIIGFSLQQMAFSVISHVTSLFNFAFLKRRQTGNSV